MLNHTWSFKVIQPINQDKTVVLWWGNEDVHVKDLVYLESSFYKVCRGMMLHDCCISEPICIRWEKAVCHWKGTLKNIRLSLLILSGPVSGSRLCVPTELAADIHPLSFSLRSSAKGIYSRAAMASNNNEWEPFARKPNCMHQSVCVSHPRGWD